MAKPVLLASATLLAFSSLALAWSSSAIAQGENASCTRDVNRHCRAVMNNGDMAVLACLQQHRAQLSRACAKVLTDNGR